MRGVKPDPDEAAAAAIACSLDATALRDRESAWRRLLAESLLAASAVPGGWLLEVLPAAAAGLWRLVEEEWACCPWIRFEERGPATVAMTAPGAGEQVLREMFAGLGPLSAG